METRRVNKWTRKEDAILLREYQYQQGNAQNPVCPSPYVLLLSNIWTENTPNKPPDWQKIALALPGRSNKDCRKRWFNVLNGDLKKGPWTIEEDKLLTQAVETQGKVWTQVARSIPQRTADQCAKRWQHFLDPTLNRSKWTESENQALWNAVKQQGRCWLQIRNDLFPSRAPNAVKNQYAFLSRRLERNRNDSPDQEEGDDNINSGTASNDRDGDTNTEQPTVDSTSPITNELPPAAPMEIFDPLSILPESMLLDDYHLSNFDYNFDTEVDITTADLGAVRQQKCNSNPPFDLCASPIDADPEAALITEFPSPLEVPNFDNQQSKTDPSASCSESTSSSRSIMTVTLTDPTPEAVNDFVRVLMTHGQEVTIQINSGDK